MPRPVEQRIDAKFDDFMDKLYDIDSEEPENHEGFVRLVSKRLGLDVADAYDEWWKEGEG